MPWCPDWPGVAGCRYRAGDRVGGYLPNMPETIAAMLAGDS